MNNPGRPIPTPMSICQDEQCENCTNGNTKWLISQPLLATAILYARTRTDAALLYASVTCVDKQSQENVKGRVTQVNYRCCGSPIFEVTSTNTQEQCVWSREVNAIY